MAENQKTARIVVVGAGFGGVRAALDLRSLHLGDAQIILISPKPHFEYYPGLYRITAGRSPLEVCVPLREIFPDTGVQLVADTIVGANLKERTLMGASGSRYGYDFLIMALGSEAAYFDIPGLKEFSFGFKSIVEALRLKDHLHNVFETYRKGIADQKVSSGQIVIVGGGASGVELAGELAVYTKQIAEQHQFGESFLTIDLIEAASRVAPAMPEDFSARVSERLRSLGVNLFLNRALVSEEIEKIHLKDLELKTKTMIWTAGVRPNHFYFEVQGLKFDAKNRVIVNEYLEPEGFPNVFVIGDAASALYAGMAQTAISQASFVARVIANKLRGAASAPYKPQPPSYAIPVGSGWAAVMVGKIKIYGRLGWWLRRLADLRFFLGILPFHKAILAFSSGKQLCESCPICEPLRDKN